MYFYFSINFPLLQSALLYANRGLALRPSDIPCLALQCQCYVELNKFQWVLQKKIFPHKYRTLIVLCLALWMVSRKALEAANGILCQEGAGNNWIALYSKGESLYNLCDFEKSLVFFHRARRQCPTKEKDKMNIRISRHVRGFRTVVDRSTKTALLWVIVSSLIC